MPPLLILVVDDDDLSLELITLMMQAEGHTVQGALSGQAALDLLDAISPDVVNSRMPDVVLTDFQMPDMSGEELCRRIRARHAMGPLLVGMSATVPREDQLQEFDAFINKPFDPKNFQSVMDKKFTPWEEPAASPGLSGDGVRCEGLDMTVVQKLRKLMPADALAELYATYLSDTRLRLNQMEESALIGDEAAVRRCAHMMKGSASMTGALGISRTAARLEAGGISLDQQRTLFDELRCACDAIEGTLARDARIARDGRIKEAHDHQIS